MYRVDIHKYYTVKINNKTWAVGQQYILNGFHFSHNLKNVWVIFLFCGFSAQGNVEINGSRKVLD